MTTTTTTLLRFDWLVAAPEVALSVRLCALWQAPSPTADHEPHLSP